LDGLGYGGWHKPGLVTAGFALVFGMAGGATVAPDMFTAAHGTQMLGKNHKTAHDTHLSSDHRRCSPMAQFARIRWGGEWDGDGHSDDEKSLDMPHFEVPR
jgi:hypothetical protein